MVRIAADALAHFHATATTSTTLETPEAQRGAIKRVMHAAIRDNLKVPFLKTAQGMIWRHGYECGALRGRLFDDAATAIRQLGHDDSKHHAAARVFSPGAVSQHIYSSGSIPAQLLLFRHSSHGDLTPALAGYHDPTVVGSKLEAASYANLKRRIASSVVAQESLGAGEGAMSAASLGLPKLVSSSADSDEQLLKGIVFVTDSLAELKAANAAGGIVGVLSVRPLNAPLSKDEGEFGAAIGGEKAAADLTSVVSFDQLVKAIAEVCGGSGCPRQGRGRRPRPQSVQRPQELHIEWVRNAKKSSPLQFKINAVSIVFRLIVFLSPMFFSLHRT
jgi:methionine salvage enolase-phosphatase E1